MGKSTRYNQYKPWRVSEDKYVITLPRNIAEKCEDIKFTVQLIGCQIVFTSGLDIMQLKKEMNNGK